MFSFKFKLLKKIDKKFNLINITRMDKGNKKKGKKVSKKNIGPKFDM